MIYHLYDHHRQHLATSESLADLKRGALQSLQDNDLPYGFIRWSDAANQSQELRVTAASLAAVKQPSMPRYYRDQTTQRSRAKGKPPQRANVLVGVAICFLVLFLTSEIAGIILR